MIQETFGNWKSGLIVSALMLVLTNSAVATLIPVGDEWEIGSWAQKFQESGVGEFDRIEISFVSTGPAFESPGLSGLSDPSWSITSYTDLGPTERSSVLAEGNALTSLQFDVLFLGEVTDPLVFAFHAWNGSTSIEAAELTWSDGAWSVITTGDCVAPVVPEPSSLVAAALLLLPVGLGAARRLRNRPAK